MTTRSFAITFAILCSAGTIARAGEAGQRDPGAAPSEEKPAETRADDTRAAERAREAGSERTTDRTDAKEAAAEVYEVWKDEQRIYVAPRAFALSLTVPRGTRLTVADRSGAWSRVQWNDSGARKAGWAQLTTRQLSAGEKAESLDKTTMSSIVFAAKWLGEMKKADAVAAEAHPQATASLESLEDESLPVDAVDTFLREGGLRLPKRG